jgi:hypothetical protein
MKKLLVLTAVLTASAFIGCGDDDKGTTPTPTPADPRLIVNTTAATPSMDSVDFPVWNQVTDSALVEIGASSTYGIDDVAADTVVMKAIKKGDSVYIYARWKDNKANLWGNFLRKKSATYEWERIIYAAYQGGEDKFFIMFDGGNNGTEKANCAAMCHTTYMQPTVGDVDVWNWKSSSTNYAKLADDEWWTADSGCADDKTWPNMEAYYTNWVSGPQMPANMHKDDTAFHGAILYRSDAVVFNKDKPWQTGDLMPGYVIDSTVYSSPARYNSSLWDVRTISKYDSSSAPYTWTVVFSRRLYTGNDDDVDLSLPDSIQISVAAASNYTEESDGWNHSGSKPFYLILKP